MFGICRRFGVRMFTSGAPPGGGPNGSVFDRLRSLSHGGSTPQAAGSAGAVAESSTTRPPRDDGYSSDEDGPVAMRRKLDRYLTDALGDAHARRVVRSAEFRSVFQSKGGARGGVDFPAGSAESASDARVAHLAHLRRGSQGSHNSGSNSNSARARRSPSRFAGQIAQGFNMSAVHGVAVGRLSEQRLSLASKLGQLADDGRDPFLAGHGRITTAVENMRFMRHRLNCVFCESGDGTPPPRIDYKNVSLLGRFVSDMGRMMPRSRTGLCRKHARHVARAVKRSRHACLMPYMSAPAVDGQRLQTRNGGVFIPRDYFAMRERGVVQASQQGPKQ